MYFRKAKMNLLLLHATGLAWDEIGFLIVPGTLVMGLVLFLSGRDKDQDGEEDQAEGTAPLSSEDSVVP
jgi:hypothetical protein